MADVTDTYYPGEAFIGYGTEWLIGDGASPEVFQAVPDVVSITPGDMTTGIVEKTHLRSPGAHKEKIATLRDSGPIQIKLNWRPLDESQSNAGGGTGVFMSGGLFAMWRARSQANHIIRLKDSLGGVDCDWPFRGVISKCQPGEITTEGKAELNVEVTPLRDFSGDLP